MNLLCSKEKETHSSLNKARFCYFDKGIMKIISLK